MGKEKVAVSLVGRETSIGEVGGGGSTEVRIGETVS